MYQAAAHLGGGWGGGGVLKGSEDFFGSTEQLVGNVM